MRLIRSKGVGVFFVTQQPTDLPDEVLAQLGLRVQHALRAFTPKDAKALRATVSTYPRSDFYDVETLLTSVGTGEAAVTLLSESGVPTPVVHTRLLAPASRDGARPTTSWAPPRRRRCGRSTASGPTRRARARSSPAGSRRLPPPAARGRRPTCARRWSTSRRRASAPPRRAPAPAGGADAIGDFLRSREGKALQRKVARGIFGMLRKRL